MTMGAAGRDRPRRTDTEQRLPVTGFSECVSGRTRSAASSRRDLARTAAFAYAPIFRSPRANDPDPARPPPATPTRGAAFRGCPFPAGRGGGVRRPPPPPPQPLLRAGLRVLFEGEQDIVVVGE